MEIISRKEAKERGLVSYFTGVRCRNGHLDKGYTNTSICYLCKRWQMHRDYSNHSFRVEESSRKTYDKDPKKAMKASKRWQENNKEKSRKIKQNYKIRNREKYLKDARKYTKEKRKDPYYRLCRNMSKAVWEWLKYRKGYKSWEELVGYTYKELVIHLQKQFKDGMAIDNYGIAWEVDHIKPLSLCVSFEEAYMLSNLQPLSIFDNRSKGNKYNDK